MTQIKKEVQDTKKKSQWAGAALPPSLILLTISGLLWFTPPPTGLEIKAWHMLIVFLATIGGIILKPLPMGAVALLGVGVGTLTETMTIKQGLVSFSSSVVWLVLCAFFVARGFVKTGLGARVAYYFMRLMGKSSLGLSYGMVLTDLLLAPAIPSNTARGGGIIYPIVRAISEEYGSSPKTNSQRKIGAFLVQVAFQANLVTSAMFLTAFAGNPLAAKLAGDFGVTLDWGTWALAACVPGVVHLMLLPLFLYLIFPPTLKKTPDAPVLATERLKAMGPLSGHEMIMLGIFGLLLFLWGMGDRFGIDPATGGIVGLGLLLFTGVLKWDDVLGEKSAWDTFFWLAILLTLASALSDHGVVKWFGGLIESNMVGVSPTIAVLVLSVIYFYCHYFFASGTAHITSLFTVFMLTLSATGASPIVSAVILSFFASLSSGLTHYGTGAAPVFFASGYLSLPTWWRIGAKSSLLSLLVWGVVGGVWWKILGYW